MSESSVHAQTPYSGAAQFASASGGYQLSDDLAKLCLPQEYKDSYRRLAWVNSLCFLFIIVGLIGLKPPPVIVRPLNEVAEVMPVELPPPEEVKPTEVTQSEPEEQPTERPTEVPQVVAVVVAADPSLAAFPVPVPGAVLAVGKVELATPPPLVIRAAPVGPTKFDPNAGGAGIFAPGPVYPSLAERNHYQGTAMIDIRVNENGDVTSVKVLKSSGFSILDDAAVEVVQRRWRFPAGSERWYAWPCKFELH